MLQHQTIKRLRDYFVKTPDLSSDKSINIGTSLKKLNFSKLRMPPIGLFCTAIERSSPVNKARARNNRSLFSL